MTTFLRLAFVLAAAVLALPPVATGTPLSQPTTATIDYSNAKYGFSLSIPASVFEAGMPRNPDDGGLWVARDGTARLIAVAAPNATGETLASYRSFVMEETYKSARFDYAPVRDTWFVLSGRQGDEMFYERITFACNGKYIYGWQIMYPLAQRRRYDPIVEAIHKSYKPGRGRDGNCG